MSRRAVVLAVLGVLLATSCTTESGQESRDAPPTTARPPAGHDLRAVRIPYRDGIAAVWPETAAQAICQALSAREWSAVLGGPASRSVTADYPTGAGCVIATDTLELTLLMTDRPLDSVAGTTESIAGHPGRVVVHNERTLVEAAVELVPTAQPRPVLSAVLGTEAAPGTALDDLLRRALAEVLPRLLPDGPTAPVPDATGQLAFPPPAPVPAVPLSDLPVAAQALVVCTALVEHTSPAPAAVRATVEDGSATCQWRQPEWVWVTLVNGSSTGTSTEIAGHPAEVTDGRISVELLDGRALLVLHRPGISAAALRTWVEQVVPALGEL